MHLKTRVKMFAKVYANDHVLNTTDATIKQQYVFRVPRKNIPRAVMLYSVL